MSLPRGSTPQAPPDWISSTEARIGEETPRGKRSEKNKANGPNLGFEEARWLHLNSNAKHPTIGQLVDDASAAIGREVADIQMNVIC